MSFKIVHSWCILSAHPHPDQYAINLALLAISKQTTKVILPLFCSTFKFKLSNRFWETDIRTVRKTNRSTIRRKNAAERNPTYQEMAEPTNKKLGTVLERALKEAVDDDTFRKVKRMSYSSNAADEVTSLPFFLPLSHPYSLAPPEKVVFFPPFLFVLSVENFFFLG